MLFSADSRTYRSAFRSDEGRKAFESWYSSMLNRAPRPYSLRDIPTRYGTTRVAVGGNPKGKPILFIHGWSGNGAQWEVAGSLRNLDADYAIYLLDVIGQPNNSSPLSPSVRGPGYGHWLDEVMDQLGLESCSVVGMSFGGFLLVKLAQVAPNRIRHAIFLAPAGFTGLRRDPEMVGNFLRAWIRRQPEAIRTFVHRNIVGHGEGFSSSQLDDIDALFQISFRHFKPGAQLPYVYKDKMLSQVKAPALLLCGEQDALFDAAKTCQRARRTLPLLREAVILPGMGHALGAGIAVDRIRRFVEAEV